MLVTLRHACLAGLLGVSTACGPSVSSREIDLTSAGESGLVEPNRAIDRDHPVPAFRIETVDGHLIDSEEWVGERPFMLVYFATWCHVCRMKLPMVRFVLERYAPELAVFGVVMDDHTTWDRVPQYLQKYDIDYELIRAERFPRFAAAFSPSGLVPAVTVVGKNGYVLEYQHGYSPSHLAGLIRALSGAEATL